MPTNLSPQAAELEKKYLLAETLPERVRALEEYLGAISKHKGTEKLRGQLKARLSKLKVALEEERKRRTGTSITSGRYAIKREGAAQIAILGMTKSGRSSLLTSLTNAEPEITDYPFETTEPIPGMTNHEDIQIQLLEAPALFEKAAEGKGWGPRVLSLARNADGLLILVDLSDEDPVAQVEMIFDELDEARIAVEKSSSRVEIERKESGGVQIVNYGNYEGSTDQIRTFLLNNGVTDAVVKMWGANELDDIALALVTGVLYKPTIIVGNKLDVVGSREKLEELEKHYGERFRVIGISCETAEGLGEIPKELFKLLDIIRIYTKKTGMEPSRKPLVMKGSVTVGDVAKEIHSQFLRQFKYARVWGSTKYAGERVGLTYSLKDKDVIEIKAS